MSRWASTLTPTPTCYREPSPTSRSVSPVARRTTSTDGPRTGRLQSPLTLPCTFPFPFPAPARSTLRISLNLEILEILQIRPAQIPRARDCTGEWAAPAHARPPKPVLKAERLARWLLWTLLVQEGGG